MQNISCLVAFFSFVEWENKNVKQAEQTNSIETNDIFLVYIPLPDSFRSTSTLYFIYVRLVRIAWVQERKHV